MNSIKSTVVITLLLGAAYVLYINKDKILRFVKSQKEGSTKAKEIHYTDAMTEVYKSFLVYANNFQGLFEPMYKASNGVISRERINNLFLEWDIRMDGVSSPHFSLSSWWSTIMLDLDRLSDIELYERAKSVIQMIKSCGIIRDDRQMLVASDDTNLYYQPYDGKSVKTGDKIRVVSPCWYMKTSPVRIIEKGFCETL